MSVARCQRADAESEVERARSARFGSPVEESGEPPDMEPWTASGSSSGRNHCTQVETHRTEKRTVKE